MLKQTIDSTSADKEADFVEVKREQEPKPGSLEPMEPVQSKTDQNNLHFAKDVKIRTIYDLELVMNNILQQISSIFDCQQNTLQLLRSINKQNKEYKSAIDSNIQTLHKYIDQRCDLLKQMFEIEGGYPDFSCNPQTSSAASKVHHTVATTNTSNPPKQSSNTIKAELPADSSNATSKNRAKPFRTTVGKSKTYNYNIGLFWDPTEKNWFVMNRQKRIWKSSKNAETSRGRQFLYLWSGIAKRIEIGRIIKKKCNQINWNSQRCTCKFLNDTTQEIGTLKLIRIISNVVAHHKEMLKIQN